MTAPARQLPPLQGPPRPPAPLIPPVAVPVGFRNTQPAALGATLTGGPVIVNNLASAFGWWTLTGGQREAVDAAYAFVLALVWWWVAARVYSPASAAKLRNGDPIT